MTHIFTNLCFQEIVTSPSSHSLEKMQQSDDQYPATIEEEFNETPDTTRPLYQQQDSMDISDLDLHHYPSTIEEEYNEEPDETKPLYQHQDSMAIDDLDLDIDPASFEHERILE